MDPNQDNNVDGNDNASEDTSPSSSLPQSPSSDEKYTFLFTSESVGEGHPDKICDQVSDAVLDAILQKDPLAKVSCQCVAKTGMILMCGDISTTSCVDFQRIARDTIEKIGYDGSVKGFDYKTCNILTSFDHHEVPSDLGSTDSESLPAGDQGLMFGYATDETDECMPLTISLSHKLNARLATLRKSGVLDWARPDSKAQVTIEYGVERGATVPIRVHTIVISVQHNEHVTLEQLRLDLMEKVIKPVIPAQYLDNDTIYHLQPSGKFIIGGPQGDAGLTGRKIIVDTYGGWGAHGGGAFSGKDGSHVVRCGSYAARWVAKSLVKAGLCRRCLVQLAYARGVAEPLSITVFSFGTSTKNNDELLNIIKHNFDLRPGKIVQDLGLQKPIFQQTAAYGHFGRPEFPWEQAKRLSF